MPPPIPTTFNLAALPQSDGFAINAGQPGESAGYSVAGGGDINGDGINDLIIGAPTSLGAGEGKVYVVYGPWNNFFRPSFLALAREDEASEKKGVFALFMG